MRRHSILSVIAILSSAACVDRINFDIGSGDTFPVVIDGFISDEPGPYIIRVSKAFDIESKFSIKTPISIKQLVLSDDQGVSEVLSEISNGVYKTDSTGIRGIVGRVYKLRVELLTGRVYESIPDTLQSAGTVDSVYFNFTQGKVKIDGTTSYGFDVFFNSSAGSKSNNYFLWKFTGTYQVKTNPQFHRIACATIADDCPNAVANCGCPQPLPCSGYIQVGSIYNLTYKSPCTCCSCWVKIYNSVPIISDRQFVEDGRFRDIKVHYAPLTPYTLMFKMHAEVKQLSLSHNAFSFWKAVKDQKEATNSLFQPVTGRISANFKQISGPPGPVEGIFFAAGVSSKAIYIVPNDVPFPGLIPQDKPFPYVNKIDFGSCLDFPNSTTKRPSFWVD